VLGPHDKGVVDLFLLVTGLIVQVGLLGFEAGLLYRLTSQKAPLSQAHGTALAVSGAIGAVFLVGGVLLSPLSETLFPGLPGWALALAAVTAPALLYGVVWRNIMLGINRPVAGYWLDATLSAVAMVGVLVLWASDRLTFGAIIWLTALSMVAASVIGFAVLMRRDARLRPSAQLARHSFAYGFVIYVAGIANVLHFRVDQIMIDHWLGTGAVGVYAIGVRWAEMLFFLDTAIAAAALYRVSVSEPRESWALTKRLAKAQLGISASSGIVLALAAPLLFPLVYGAAYGGAPLATILLIPGVVAWSSAKLVSNMLTYNVGRATAVLWISVIGLALNVVLTVVALGVLDLGINGAAVASSLSYGVVAIGTVIAARGIMRARTVA
jgi:O-antigen/teichoic acid export membrane protein